VRFLASGDKYPSLMYSLRVARNTISVDIPEVAVGTFGQDSKWLAISILLE